MRTNFAATLNSLFGRSKTYSTVLRGVKNASYLAIGNFVAQLIGFFGFIYIARMLGPHNYGIYTTVGVFVGIFVIFTFTGLNKVILREGSKDVSMMHKTLEKTIGIRNLFILVAIIACIISSFFTNYEFQTKLYIFLVSFDLIYKGIEGFLSNIYQASEKMQYISIFSVLERIIVVPLSISFLYLGFGLLSLFLIRLLSHFFILIVNFRFSKKFVDFKFLSNIQFDKLLIKPAIIFSLIVFISTLGVNVDLLMISFLGTAKDVGIYGISHNIALRGLMLRNFVAIAFFPIFVKRFHNGRMKGIKLIQYSLLLLIGIFILCLLITYFVEPAIIFLFGLEYENSGEILKVLIFYLCFMFATLPFTSAIQATYNEKILLKVSAVHAVLNIPLNYIFFFRYGLIGIAYSTLLVLSTGSLITCILGYQAMKKQGYLI